MSEWDHSMRDLVPQFENADNPEPTRISGRATAAAIVAVGLTLSATLYSVPATQHLLEKANPRRDITQSPELIESAVFDGGGPYVSLIELPGLVRLGNLVAGSFSALPTETVLRLVRTYGLLNVLRSLEALSSLTQNASQVPVGGGGSSTPVERPPLLGAVIDYLILNPPELKDGGYAEFLITLWPAILQSLGLAQSAPAPTRETISATFAATPSPAAPPEPAPGPAVVPAVSLADIARVAPTPPPVVSTSSPIAEITTLTPAETLVHEVGDAPAATSPDLPTSQQLVTDSDAPSTSNSVVSNTYSTIAGNSPSALDSTSNSSGSVDDGSSTGPGEGTTSGSAGDPAGGSASGASAGSDGGSAGGASGSSSGSSGEGSSGGE
jgi:hypothetical protein